MDTIENSYQFESKNRYILEPSKLLVSKNDIEVLLENNYLYISSDLEDAKNTIKTSYANLPPVMINYNYKDPFINIHKVLNSSNYGVPQNRRRMILVGLSEGVSFQYPKITHWQEGSRFNINPRDEKIDISGLKKHVNVESAISDLPKIT